MPIWVHAGNEIQLRDSAHGVAVALPDPAPLIHKIKVGVELDDMEWPPVL